MVITLLADANIKGHVARLVARMQAERWREFWDYLQVRCVVFSDVGLDPADSDSVIWQCCQQQQILLLTNNRNEDGPDSLEATIRTFSTPVSLPVFTVGDADRILSDKDYADRVIDRLFRYLLEIDAVRGAGRLFLP
jgi:hypothetical protein